MVRILAQSVRGPGFESRSGYAFSSPVRQTWTLVVLTQNLGLSTYTVESGNIARPLTLRTYETVNTA